MQKNSFVLQTRLNAVVAKLSDKQAGVLFKSILNYAENGTIANFEDSAVGIAFEFVRQDIDYNSAKYEETCKRNSENGKLGGRPKKRAVFEKASGFLENPKKANGFLEKHNDNDVDVENDMIMTVSKKESNKEKDYFPFVGKPLEPVMRKWLEYRKQIKKPYKSPIAIEECYKRLEKLSGGSVDLAEKVVNQSIAGQWQGLFELKQDANGGTQNGGQLGKYAGLGRKFSNED